MLTYVRECFIRKGIQLLCEWKISIYIEYSYKEKLSIGEYWLHQLEVFPIYRCPSYSKGKGGLLPDNIKIDHIDNS